MLCGKAVSYFVFLRRDNFSVSCANLIPPHRETLSCHGFSSLGNPGWQKTVSLKQQGSLSDSFCRTRNLEDIYLEQDCDINYGQIDIPSKKNRWLLAKAQRVKVISSAELPICCLSMNSALSTMYISLELRGFSVKAILSEIGEMK